MSYTLGILARLTLTIGAILGLTALAILIYGACVRVVLTLQVL